MLLTGGNLSLADQRVVFKEVIVLKGHGPSKQAKFVEFPSQGVRHAHLLLLVLAGCVFNVSLQHHLHAKQLPELIGHNLLTVS